jgi:hypothetical protein
MPRFYLLGLIAAIAVAWIGGAIHQSGHAPLGLVSIGVGAALGAILATIAATLRVAGRRSRFIATLVFASVTILAQHAWLYASFRREWHEGRENSPRVAMFRDESPWTPWEYMAHEATRKRVTLWCVDAVLIMAIAFGTVWVLGPRPQLNSASRPTPKNPDL